MSRMPEVGDVVDDVFYIEEKLDQGNFGVIFRVRDERDERATALKIHKPAPKNEEELRQRFEREARLMYSLDHPHVVEVLYYGETETELPYMAMEFLHGTDLKSLIRGGGSLEGGSIRRITLETLSALRAAHQLGIVHRDLKPGNIFLVGGDAEGRVKVLDFGFAKSLDNPDGDLTRSGTLVGSPAYMSPELVHKENVGPHSDLYSMGLILGEMIRGDKLVDAESIYDTLMYQASDEPVELPDDVRESPFRPVVERAVQKEVDARYESANAMMRELEELSVETGDPTETSSQIASALAPTRADEATPPLEEEPLEVDDATPRAETIPESLGPSALGELEDVDHTGSGSERTASPSGGADIERGETPVRTAHSAPPDKETDEHESISRRSRRETSGRVAEPIPEETSTRGEQARRSRTSDGTTMDLERDETREWSSDERPEIDRERPTSSADASADGEPSLLMELLLGVFIGLLGLVVVLVVMAYV